MSTKKTATAAAKTATKPAAKKAAPSIKPPARSAAGQPQKATQSKSKPFAPSAAMKGAFGALGKSGEGALAAMFAKGSDVQELIVDLDDIEIVEQVREEFEDDGQDLLGLGESLKAFQIQSILLRIMPADHPKKYRLVAGERRVRAARLVGLTKLRALARKMTDQEAEDFQFAENIHRKNLTQIEEAKRIQKDLNELGSVDAVLEKHKKKRPWLSKWLSLLQLPGQTKRLLTENISADFEVINNVKQVEKADPSAAAELVEKLKATRGKEDARSTSQKAKEKVKPSKKTRESKQEKGKQSGGQQQTDIFADAKLSGPAGSAPINPAPAATLAANGAQVATPRDVLSKAYEAIFDRRSKPISVLEGMGETGRDAATEHLMRFYEAGKQSKDTGRAVIEGFRSGHFSTDGDGAFCLVAFLHGADSGATFDLLNVLGAVKE